MCREQREEDSPLLRPLGEEERWAGALRLSAPFTIDQTPDHAHAVLNFGRDREVSSSARVLDRSRSRSPRERRIATMLNFDEMDGGGPASMRRGASSWLFDDDGRPPPRASSERGALRDEATAVRTSVEV